MTKKKIKKKDIREKGKISLAKYFQKFEKGNYVCVKREKSLRANFPLSIQGRTGTIEGERGEACIVKIKDIKKDKIYLIKPVHLKKIKLAK